MPKKDRYYLQEQFSEHGGDKIFDKFNDYSHWIGRFLLEFSGLEIEIDRLINQHISDRTDSFGYQTLKYLNLKSKISFLHKKNIELIHYVEDDSRRNKLLISENEINSTLEELRVFRNVICHAEWWNMDDNNFVKFKINSDKQGVYFDRRRVTCKDIYNYLRKCESISKKLDPHIESILTYAFRTTTTYQDGLKSS